ncbi:MAG: hypothetical protein ABH817_01395 [archaeon]
MIEVQNWLRILQKIKRAVKEKDTLTIKELSNHTIHGASIYQDPNNIALAVTIYALSKLVEHEEQSGSEEEKLFFKSFNKSIDNAIRSLKNKDFNKFEIYFEKMRNDLEKLAGSLKEYIKDVFTRAKVTKASKIYEHGISREKTAKLLGLSQWELAEYIGATVIEMDLAVTLSIHQRFKLAESFFK